jgi:epoxide hydrolase-like predicted phosphatase
MCNALAVQDHHEPLRAVFFDFGGVFITSPFAATAAAAAERGMAEGDLMELIFGSYERDDDHPWHRLERGELAFDAANAEIAAMAIDRGFGSIEPIEVLMSLAHGYEMRDFMVELVRDLRTAGIATGIITNNIAELGGAWRSLLPLDELFDDVVDSCEVGMRKPNPAIFHLACERLGVTPAQSGFIDDHQGNVAAATAVGMRSIWCGLSAESTRVAALELREWLR